MAGIDFSQVRQQVSLGLVLELLGFVPVARVGEQVRGPCPLHRSRSPRSRSFAAHLGRGVWHCFVCGAGGNTLDLWAQVTGQGVYAAALDLCQRLGLAVPRLAGRRRVSAPPTDKNTLDDSQRRQPMR
jgi:DNA primase